MKRLLMQFFEGVCSKSLPFTKSKEAMVHYISIPRYFLVYRQSLSKFHDKRRT